MEGENSATEQSEVPQQASPSPPPLQKPTVTTTSTSHEEEAPARPTSAPPSPAVKTSVHEEEKEERLQKVVTTSPTPANPPQEPLAGGTAKAEKPRAGAADTATTTTSGTTTRAVSPSPQKEGSQRGKGKEEEAVKGSAIHNSNWLEASTEMLKAAMHAVALEDSLESTDALMTAAREVYADRSAAPSRGPVLIPTVPSIDAVKTPPPQAASPKAPAASPPPIQKQQQQQPEGAGATRDSPRLKLTAVDEREKKGEESPVPEPRAAAAPAAEEKKPARQSTIQLSKAESSDDGRSGPESGNSSRESSPSPRSFRSHRTNKALNTTSSSRASSAKRRRRKTMSNTGSSYYSSSSSLLQTQIGKKLSRLASEGMITLSTTQLRVLEAALPHEIARMSSTGGGKSASLGSTTPRIKELAKPVRSQAAKQQYRSAREKKLGTYALLDDAKECTFRPKIHRWSGAEQKDGDDDDEGDGGGKSKAKRAAFMDRQFSTEQARRRALEKARKEKDYSAKVDKRRCPSCGGTQSFDEVVEKKKQCPNCHVDYEYRVQWQKVSKNFHRRQEEFAKAKDENSKTLLAEALAEIGSFEKMVVDPETGKLQLMRTEPLLWDEAVAESFFERSSEYAERRAQRLREAEGGGKGVSKRTRKGKGAAAWGGSDDEEEDAEDAEEEGEGFIVG